MDDKIYFHLQSQQKNKGLLELQRLICDPDDNKKIYSY